MKYVRGWRSCCWYFSVRDGDYWVRIGVRLFGLRRYSKHYLLFSERMGTTHVHRWGDWIVTVGGRRGGAR